MAFERWTGGDSREIVAGSTLDYPRRTLAAWNPDMATNLQVANPCVRTPSQAPFVLEADAKAVHDIHRVRRALSGPARLVGRVQYGPEPAAAPFFADDRRMGRRFTSVTALPASL